METNIIETVAKKSLRKSGIPDRELEPGLKRFINEREEYRKRLDLLCRVGKSVGSGTELSKLLDQILRMTQQTLHAEASSMLLLDQGKKDLYFMVTEGQAENTLRQKRVSLDSGIAGWVARQARPVIANNVTRDYRFNKEIDKVTGFKTKSILAVPLISDQKVIGVLEILNKVSSSGFSEQDLEVSIALASMAAIAIINAKLHKAVLEGYKGTVKALAAAIDAKDPYTCGHSQRVMEYAMMAATRLSFSPEQLQLIEFGSLLHDVGKIGISDSILRKSGRLTPEEWVVMRRHPLIGANIVGEVPFLEAAKGLVLYHHEKYDGTGYPEGLQGEAIPLGSRLLAVADAFDTMTTARSYRGAQSVNNALSELTKLAGRQFCPIAVEAFVSGFRRR